MNFEEYIKNETKNLNLKYLSEETRNFIPKISGNFIEDKKFFSNFWNKVRLEKVSLKKEKKITKINIKEINTFCNITKKIFLNKYSALIYRQITNDLKIFIRVEELCSKANTVVENPLPSFEECQIVLFLHVIVLLPPCILKVSKELPFQALISVVTALLPALLLGSDG